MSKIGGFCIDSWLDRCDGRPQVQRNQRRSPDCQPWDQIGKQRPSKEQVD